MYSADHDASDILVYPRFENLDIGDVRDTVQLHNWVIHGLEYGVNTDADGRLYVKLTDENPGAGQALVQVYKDSAMANLVLQGNAADLAQVALAEQNSSGLTGTVDLGTIAASDEIELIVLDPFLHRANKYDTDDTDKAVEELLNKSVSAQSDLCGVLEDQINSMLASIKSDMEEYSVRGVMKEISGATSGSVLLYDYTVNSNGAVSLEYDGILRTIFDAMTADAKTLLQNTVAAGALTAATGNTGTLSATTNTPHEHCYDGDVITVRCLKGLDSTRETFIVESKYLGRAANVLTVEEDWIDARLGIALKLDRTIIDADAGVAGGAAQVGTWALNGETSSNTDSGVLYGSISQVAGTDYIYLWTSAADRDAADTTSSTLVASGSVLDVGGGETVTLTQQNSSGLSGSVIITYAADRNFDVDLQVCVEGDRWTIALTNDYAGKLHTAIGHLWHISLPNGAAASAEMPDAVCAIPEDFLMESDI